VDYGSGGSPWSIAIGDVNGDGKLDLASGNYSSNTVSVFLGNGDGTFGAKVDYVALTRFCGHLPKGGYDVPHGQDRGAPQAAQIHG
jgi:FG-GAP-like repeat